MKEFSANTDGSTSDNAMPEYPIKFYAKTCFDMEI